MITLTTIRKQKTIKYNCLILFIFFFLSVPKAYPQYKFRYDNDYLTDLTFGPDSQNGFRVNFSLVAVFTAGAADRNGFRLGAGVNIEQTIDNWKFTIGLDAYKATQQFGIGTSYAGVIFDDGKYGGSYYLNRYYQGDKQTSAILGVRLNDFRVRFEDDILAYPFVGFKIYDRFRTGALEVRYKGFMIGTNVYTTDLNGVTDYFPSNRKGVYADGKQISSPIYVGYSDKNLFFRYGINSRIGGIAGQGFWHRYLFSTPDFKHNGHSNHFFQIGVDKPYTLY